MQLPYDLLRTFVAVADTKNFTKAGQIVNRTQSAVSMQVKRLESEVGQPIFERKGGMKGITLTAKGDELLGYARRLLALHDEAVAAVSNPGIEGVVRLGIPEDFSSTFLPGILARFSRTNPSVQIDVLCAPGDQIETLLQEEKLDLGIRSGVESIHGAEILRQEPVYWITSPSSLVHEHNPVPLAVFYDSCTYRKWAIRSLQNINKDYRVAFSSQSTSGIYAAVRAGLAVGVTGKSNLNQNLRILGPDDGFPKLPDAMVTLHQKASPLQPPEECLAEHIREEFNAIPASLPF